jgi:hypothetical protein
MTRNNRGEKMKFVLKSAAKTVTTAGTRVALSTTQVWARGLQISAPAANAGVVYIGDITVAASNGLSLAAGSSVSLAALFKDIDNMIALNLASIYVDSATNGDKVTLVYLEPTL